MPWFQICFHLLIPIMTAPWIQCYPLLGIDVFAVIRHHSHLLVRYTPYTLSLRSYSSVDILTQHQSPYFHLFIDSHRYTPAVNHSYTTSTVVYSCLVGLQPISPENWHPHAILAFCLVRISMLSSCLAFYWRHTHLTMSYESYTTCLLAELYNNDPPTHHCFQTCSFTCIAALGCNMSIYPLLVILTHLSTRRVLFTCIY